MSNSNNSNEINNNGLNILINNSVKNNSQETSKIPKNIGPYEIIKKLKDGGYSKIYLAQSRYTGDNVCIKIIEKIPFQENVEDLLLATRQIETLKILKHRNIMSLFEVYESPNFIFLITEYLSGKDLIELLIAKKRFSEEEAQKIFFQLVDALYYMHKMNICHRDIRTEHIIFDKNKTPKIVGFSYSTFYTKNQKLKDSFGSLCYACPEIILENSYDPELADIWSLGVVLYVMVCGYLPFGEENDEKNKDLIIHGKIEFPKEMTNKLKDLLRHMLDVNSKKRYNFTKIMKHPWFKPYNEELLMGGCNLYKMIYPIEQKILNIIQIFGLNKKNVEKDIKDNKYNIGTGLYRHLVIKLNEMGFKSLSDLGSKEYLQYRNDKNNYYLDGENNYNNHLNKVQEKIEKIEKFISDYQEKEENIIVQLNNFEEANLSMVKSEENKSRILNNSDINNNISFSENKYEKKEKENYIKCENVVNDLQEKINKKYCHKRTLTPMFALKELEYEQMNSSNNNENENLEAEEIGHINKDEINLINKSKKVDKRKNILLNINKELRCSGQKLFRAKSSPNIKNLVIKLMNENSCNTNKYKNIKNLDITRRIDDSHNITTSYAKWRDWRDTSMIIRRKKNYLNCSSFLDSYLKKPHPDNLRRNDAKNSLLNDINQIIIEENNNNSIINNSGNTSNNNINNEGRKSKQIKYSLSFGDDDEDEEDESSYISKIDSKQVSIYDIDEELKVLKEIGNTNIKSPNLKTNNNNVGSNKYISNFTDKIQSSNKNLYNYKTNRNTKKNKNINNNNNESPIIFKSNQAEMSFHDDTNDNNNNNILLSTNKNEKNKNIKNINNIIIRSNSNIENSTNNKIISNFNHKGNAYNRAYTFNIDKKNEEKEKEKEKEKEEKEEISIFYNDKKKVAKIYLNNENEKETSIDFIHNKEKSKYSYSYFKDILPIKRIDNITQINLDNCCISDIDKIFRKNDNTFIINKEKVKEKKYFNRNNVVKFNQKKTFDNIQEKNKNIVIIENNNTSKRSPKEKNNNMRNGKLKIVKQNNNDYTEKKHRRKESIEVNNNENNICPGLMKEDKNDNKKFSNTSTQFCKDKNHKFNNNNNKKIENKKNEKDKNMKNAKIQKIKYKSEISSKYHEELNFTNISDLSDIRALSILSPENRIQNIYDNKENVLYCNILPKKLNIDKTFKNQNQLKYHISNLSVSHENNIICKGKSNIININNNDRQNKFSNSMSHFYNNNNSIGKMKKVDDNYLNFDELDYNNNDNFMTYEKFENNTHNIYNNRYNDLNNYSNIDCMNKNTYNNNFIVTIKKRNLAEKLKEEIKKSMNKNNLNSPLITNGRINLENNNNIILYNNNMKNYFKNDINNDDIEYNFENKKSNLTNIIFNGSMQQSNGKKIRDKIIRCSSMLTKNNIYEDENEDDNSSIPKNKNQSTLVNNYHNNIPLRQYDLNSSQYVTQYINMDNTNTINNINVSSSISSINNQTDFNNYKSSSMNKENNSDYLFYALQNNNNNKRDGSEVVPKKKNIIRIKKNNKLSNSIILENGEKNNLINQNHSIYVNKSKKKSNGKKFNIVNSTNVNDYNKTITISKKNSDLLIKNLKYKCLNGKAKNIDLNNDNIIILSKHKKNYDNDFNYAADKLTTCSIPQLTNTNNNNNIVTNSDCKNSNKILSEFVLPKNKKNINAKITNKKLSFTGNNSNNKKNANYKKKNNNINCKIKNKNKLSNRKNNVNCKSKINIYEDDGEGKTERNKEEVNICDSLTMRCSQKTFRNIKNNNSVIATSKKNERKKSSHGYKKKLFF